MGDAMSRQVPEWIGRTPDSRPPPRVRLRIFQREDGRCYLSGRKIAPGDAWELEHKIAIINGGENRESNLFPALKDKHKEKTKADLAEKSHVADLAKSHIGAKPTPARPIKSRGFPRTRKEPRIPKNRLPPRPLYREID